MNPIWWLVTFLMVILLAEIVVPGDTTLKIYIGVFFMGGALRGIINTLWRTR